MPPGASPESAARDLRLRHRTRFNIKLDSVFSFRPLFRNELAIVARKGHSLRHAQSLAALAQAEWISVFPSAAQNPLEYVFSTLGLPAPEQLILCDSFNVALHLLLKTDAIGVISRLTLDRVVPRDYLHQIPVVEPMPGFSVGIFTRWDSPLSRPGRRDGAGNRNCRPLAHEPALTDTQ